MIGNIFGRLKVIGFDGFKIYPSKQKRKLWRCLCECGNEKTVLDDALKSGSTQSCGCLQKERTSSARRIDLTGKHYGKLTVLRFDKLENNQAFWWCRCECGKEKSINGSSLRNNRSNSCGCRQGKFTHGMWGKSGYKKLYLSDPVKKIRHIVGGSVGKAMKKRGLSKGGKVFDHLPYTPQQLKEHLEKQFEPWMNWENYGGKNNSTTKTWHIEHIKPQISFPYVSLDDCLFQECWALDNLRPLEKIENMKKGSK